ALTGQPLALPNIATWWCGQAQERDYVKANAERMTIGNAFATRLLFDLDDVSAVGGNFNRDVRETVENWIDHGGGQLVGQEAIMLSTTPAFDGAQLVPRPMSLRVFLARTPSGWEVMPGGFARIGRSSDSAALAMQSGGSAADVWVIGREPVSSESMLSNAGAGGAVRQQPGVLPSRAADNLYWMGRYVERAENAIRILRSYHSRLADMSSTDAALLEMTAGLLKGLDADPDERFPLGLQAMLKSASTSAGHVRDRFSVDGWHALYDLDKTVTSMSETVRPGDDMVRAMTVLLRKISGFSGLIHDNMYRFMGWRFLSIGKAVERAYLLCTLLAELADPGAPDGSLDLAVEAADSVMSHRRRYAVSTSRETVIDLLALDPLNPRSIICQLNEIASHIEYLPNTEFHRQLSPLQRQMLQTKAALAVHTPDTLGTEILTDIRGQVGALSDFLSSAYLR
ncbi:MAG: alpha-E domain-containing protein, partial [Rhodobiaceae bacterium]|nr:alpha-E domain-containing protein [Rhodobiaceae bacterium]